MLYPKWKYLMPLIPLVLVLSIVFLEWLDFTLYLYLAHSLFANVFFPPSDNSMMLSFALFAAAYVARPLGGYFFGKAADRTGRRMPMLLSSGLMGFATLGMCLLPGYQTIGIAAPWLLLCCRLIQGLAIGGEINTSAMFLIEHHPERPLLYGSFIAASGAAGMFLGGMIASVLVDSHLLWRFVFAGLGFFSVAVAYTRKRLMESPEFEHAPKTALPWRMFTKELLKIACIAVYVSIAVYICNIYWVNFAMSRHIWSYKTIEHLGAFTQLSSAVLAIIIAWYSKPESANRLLRISTVILAFAAPVLFYSTQYNIKTSIYIALIGYILANGFLCSGLFYFLYKQLPIQNRCQGVNTTWGCAACAGALALPFTAKMASLGIFWVAGALPAGAAFFTFWMLFL